MRINLRMTTALAAFAVVASSVFAGPVGGNRLVVLQIGADDRTANAVGGVATEQFLNEFDKTPLSARIQQIPVPAIASAPNRAATQSPTATSAGHLNLSVNGQYITFVGYDAPAGTASITSTAVSTVNRVIGRLELSTGTIDTSTFLTAQYNADNFRNAVTVDGTAYWTAGNSNVTPSATGGTWYVSHGDPAAGGAFRTNIDAVVNNTRIVNIFGGQLYMASGSGNFRGVNTVGTGLPTATAPVTLLTGFEAEFLPTNQSPSQYDFELVGNDTIYVVDDRTAGTFTSRRGIQKWKLISGVWTYQYSMQTASNTLFRTLAVETIAPGVVRLYTVTSQTTVNSVVSIDDVLTDTSNSSSFVTLQTAPTFTTFRGVELTPAPSGGPTATGTVDFGQLGGSPYNSGTNLPTSIPVSFRDASNTEIATGSATYDPVTGAFSANVPGAVTVPYRVSFKHGFWLRKTMPNPVDPAAPVGNYAFGTVAPQVGDADDDNAVTPSDYGIWQAENGTFPTENTSADFDGDGAVTPSDYGLWQINNGAFGDD